MAMPMSGLPTSKSSRGNADRGQCIKWSDYSEEQTVPVSAAVQASLSSDLPDGEVARRIITGDVLAFETLMRKHNRILYHLARAVLRDNAEAEDALQLAYLHAYQAIASYRGESKLSTWLTRIVLNEALMRARRRRRESMVIPLESMSQQSDIARVENAESSTERPDNAAMRSETRAFIERRIDALPEIFRTVFVMRALEELSVEETAVALDIPERPCARVSSARAACCAKRWHATWTSPPERRSPSTARAAIAS
jgi:RNA polymerase sigma-70 factor (ECF subfamily)